jgi:hypothetical protein
VVVVAAVMEEVEVAVAVAVVVVVVDQRCSCGCKPYWKSSYGIQSSSRSSSTLALAAAPVQPCLHPLHIMPMARVVVVEVEVVPVQEARVQPKVKLGALLSVLPPPPPASTAAAVLAAVAGVKPTAPVPSNSRRYTGSKSWPGGQTPLQGSHPCCALGAAPQKVPSRLGWLPLAAAAAAAAAAAVAVVRAAAAVWAGAVELDKRTECCGWFPAHPRPVDFALPILPLPLLGCARHPLKHRTVVCLWG